MAVTPEHIFALQTVAGLGLSPDGNRLAYVVSEVDRAEDGYRATLWLAEAEGTRSAPLESTRKILAPRWSPDGARVAFLAGDAGSPLELRAVAPEPGAKVQTLVEGFEVTAFAWSPDGRWIAFAACTGPPDATRSGAEYRPRVVRRAYHRAEGRGFVGDERHALFVLAAAGGPARRLVESVAADSAPAWSPDGTRIAFARRRTGRLDHTQADLFAIALDGGRETQLCASVPCAAAPAWSPRGDRLACFGAEPESLGVDGPMVRVWLVDASGSRDPRCAAPEFEGSAMLPRGAGPLPAPVWSRDGCSLTFTAADRGNLHVVRADTATGRVDPVVGGERQVFLAHACATAGRIACVVSEAASPGDVHVFDWNGAGERRWVALGGAFRSAAADLEIERRSFESGHGAALDGWLYRSRGSGGPLPLAVSVHGGPHGFVGNGFSATHFYRYVLASRGWAVLALNASGSLSYGEPFARRIAGRWGELDLPEQLGAVDALVRNGIADPHRLAIVGYSYGGFLASFAIGQTDRFRAAVIGAPITNLVSCFGTSDIGPWFCGWEMDGDPDSRRETYERLSPVTHAHRATTPALLLHGEGDERCPIGQSEELFARLVRGGSAVEFVRYPAASHSFPGSGRPSHRVDYATRIVDWLQRHAAGAVTEKR
jgi:dipeptidyl aminopeptidase/acylaminoacyl peptidase